MYYIMYTCVTFSALYAVTPPMEAFMGVPALSSKKHFYQVGFLMISLLPILFRPKISFLTVLHDDNLTNTYIGSSFHCIK